MKLAIQAHSKRTQEAGGQYRASAHTQTNYAVERISVALTDKGVQANHEPRAMERATSKSQFIYSSEVSVLCKVI